MTGGMFLSSSIGSKAASQETSWSRTQHAGLTLKLLRVSFGLQAPHRAPQTQTKKESSLLFLLVGCEQVQPKSRLPTSGFLDVQTSQQPGQKVQLFFSKRVGSYVLLQETAMGSLGNYLAARSFDIPCMSFIYF